MCPACVSRYTLLVILQHRRACNLERSTVCRISGGTADSHRSRSRGHPRSLRGPEISAQVKREVQTASRCDCARAACWCWELPMPGAPADASAHRRREDEHVRQVLAIASEYLSNEAFNLSWATVVCCLGGLSRCAEDDHADFGPVHCCTQWLPRNGNCRPFCAFLRERRRDCSFIESMGYV